MITLFVTAIIVIIAMVFAYRRATNALYLKRLEEHKILRLQKEKTKK